MIILILIYLIGCLISFGITTSLQYRIDIQYVKHLQPEYQSPWHSPIIAICTWFSWLGVIVFGIVAVSIFGKITLKYSFKPLWATYINSVYK